jgi:hypothetical protein
VVELAGVDENLCTTDCDPLLQTGCPAAGTKCDLGSSGGGFSHCTGVGAAAQDAPCTATADCAAGLTCTSVNSGPLACYTWCDVENPDCPDQTLCTSFSPALTIGAIEYGICT